MAGHSKWANIKHKKAKEDAKKGKVFTRFSKEITVAAREGGGDPSMNPRLRTIIEKAKIENMPSENIQRAIKKGCGELEGATYEQVMYEGYGPYGVAVMIEALTDNKNRTVADIRHVFSKMGGSLAENGAVSWMFKHMGVVTLHTEKDEDSLLEILLEYEVFDINREGTMVRIYCDPAHLFTIKHGMEEEGITVSDAQLEWVPTTSISVDAEQEEKVCAFLEKLDDVDDIQNIYANLA